MLLRVHGRTPLLYLAAVVWHRRVRCCQMWTSTGVRKVGSSENCARGSPRLESREGTYTAEGIHNATTSGGPLTLPPLTEGTRGLYPIQYGVAGALVSRAFLSPNPVNKPRYASKQHTAH